MTHGFVVEKQLGTPFKKNDMSLLLLLNAFFINASEVFDEVLIFYSFRFR